MKRIVIPLGILLVLCVLVFGAMSLLGGGPKEVYLISSLQKFYPAPPKSVSEEFSVSYSNWDTKKALWSAGNIQNDYIEVCQMPYVLCSWVRTWGVDTFRSDPVIRQKIGYSSSSNNTGVILLIIFLVVVFFIIVWPSRFGPPMTPEQWRHAQEDYH
jgi:hypothetical protein